MKVTQHSTLSIPNSFTCISMVNLECGVLILSVECLVTVKSLGPGLTWRQIHQHSLFLLFQCTYAWSSHYMMQHARCQEGHVMPPAFHLFCI